MFQIDFVLKFGMQRNNSFPKMSMHKITFLIHIRFLLNVELYRCAFLKKSIIIIIRSFPQEIDSFVEAWVCIFVCKHMHLVCILQQYCNMHSPVFSHTSCMQHFFRAIFCTSPLYYIALDIHIHIVVSFFFSFSLRLCFSVDEMLWLFGNISISKQFFTLSISSGK